MKGISLPVNAVIIIAIAILVLVVVAYFFVSGTAPFKSANYEQEFNKGCKIYKQTGTSANQIILDDVNNDGEDDSLLEVCRIYFSNQSMDSEGCENQCDKRFPS